MSPSVSPIHKNQKNRKNDLQCRRNNQDDALNSGQGGAAEDGRRGKADRSHVNLGHFSLWEVKDEVVKSVGKRIDK